MRIQGIIVGPFYCGKTTMFRTWKHGRPTYGVEETIGINFWTTITSSYRLTLWDTAGKVINFTIGSH